MVFSLFSKELPVGIVPILFPWIQGGQPEINLISSESVIMPKFGRALSLMFAKLDSVFVFVYYCLGYD